MMHYYPEMASTSFCSPARNEMFLKYPSSALERRIKRFMREIGETDARSDTHKGLSQQIIQKDGNISTMSKVEEGPITVPPSSPQAKLLSPVSHSGSTEGTNKWNKRYQELVAFKNEFGHCKIPSQKKEYKALHSWIGKQREAYKAFKTTGTGSCTVEKIKLLHSIGISLEPYSTNWNMRFQELVLFQKEYGHCKVPQQGKSEYTRLGQWLARQKKDLRPSYNMVRGSLPYTTQDLERARLLESLGVLLTDKVEEG